MGRRAADPTTPVPVLGVPALVGVRGWRTAGGERAGAVAQLTWSQCSIGVQTSPAIRILKSQLDPKHPDALTSQPKCRASKLTNGSSLQVETTDEEYKQGVLKTNKWASLKHRGNDGKSKKGVTFEGLNDSAEDGMDRVSKREVQYYATAIKTNPYLPGGTVSGRALGKREQRYTNGSVVDSELIGGICSVGDGERDSAPEQQATRIRVPAVVHSGKRRTPPGPPPSRAPPRICQQCGGRQAPSPQVDLDPVKDLISPTLLSPTEREIWSPLTPSPGINSAPPRQITRELTFPLTHKDPTLTPFPLHPIIKINKDGRPDTQVTRPSTLEQETRVTRVYPIFAPQRDTIIPLPAHAPPVCPVRATSPPSVSSPPLKPMMTVTVTQETKANFTPRHSLARPNTLVLPTPQNTHASISRSSSSTHTTSKPQQTIALTGPQASQHVSPPKTPKPSASAGLKCMPSQQTDTETVTSKMPPAYSNTHPKISAKPNTRNDALPATMPLTFTSMAHQNASRPPCLRNEKRPCTPYVRKRKLGSISDHSTHSPSTVPETCPSRENTVANVKTHSRNEQPCAASKIASRQSLPVKDPLIPRSVDTSPAIPLTHPGIHSEPVTVNGTNTDFKHSTSTCKYLHAHCKPSPRPETCHKPILKIKGGKSILCPPTTPPQPHRPVAAVPLTHCNNLYAQLAQKPQPCTTTSTKQRLTEPNPDFTQNGQFTAEAAVELESSLVGKQTEPSMLASSPIEHCHIGENASQTELGSDCASGTPPMPNGVLTNGRSVPTSSHSHPENGTLLVPSFPRCTGAEDPQRSLLSVEASVQANQERITNLLNIIQDLEMNQALSRG